MTGCLKLSTIGCFWSYVKHDFFSLPFRRMNPSSSMQGDSLEIGFRFLTVFKSDALKTSINDSH